jgi:hypothetical protein
MRPALAAIIAPVCAALACAALAGCSPPPGPGTAPADIIRAPTFISPSGNTTPNAGPYSGTTGPYFQGY